MIKKLHVNRSLAFAALAIFMILPGKGWGQTNSTSPVLLDNYDGVGGLTYTPNAASQWSITGEIYVAGTNALTTPEHSCASYDLTSSISSWNLVKTNQNVWIGHFKILRNTSGWGTTNYGCGAVLASNLADFSSASAQGYALVIENGSLDKVTLVKFSQGIKDGATNLPSNATAIVSVTVNPGTTGFNFLVELLSDGKWKISYVTGTQLSDANAIVKASYSGGNATSASADETYTGINYKYTGWVFAHSSGDQTADKANFDNLGAAQTNPSSSNSDIIANTSFTYPINIAYGSYQGTSPLTTGTSIEVGQFDIRDGDGGVTADADALTTTLTDLTLNVANPGSIKRIALFDGTTNVGEVAGGATAAFSALTLAAADNGSKTFSVRVSFLSGVTDNQQFSFTVNSATALGTGSGFATSNAGGAASSVSGDNNRIEVSATALVFGQNTSNVVENTAMSPAPTIIAKDANINTDLDFVGSVTLTPSAGTISAGNPVTAIGGTTTFSNLQFSTLGTGITIAGTSGSLTATGNSNPFNVTVAPVQAAGILLLEDNFTATSGVLTSNGWTQISTTATNPINTGSGNGLSYANYGSTGIGNSAIMGSAGGQDIYRTFTSQDPGAGSSTVYYSCLVNLNTVATGDYFIALGESSSFTGSATYRARIYTKQGSASNKILFGISTNGTVTYGITEYNAGATILVVVKHVFTTSTSTSSIFINPSLVNEPTSADLTDNTASTVSTGLNAIVLRQGGSTSSSALLVDGVRVGTNWGSVLGNPQYENTTNIAAGNYNNVSLLSGSAVTLTGNVNINGTTTLTAGTLNVGANTLTLAGSSIVRASGSIDASAGTVAFTNTSALVIPANTFIGNFNSLTMNGAGGVTFNTDRTITGTLTLTNGLITTGTNVLTASGTITRTAGYINGNLQKTAIDGSPVIFETGTSVYAPTTVTVSGITGGSVLLTAKATNGSPVAGSGINPSAKCNHYWTITKTGAGSLTGYTAKFDFTNSTNTGTLANYIVKKYDGSWVSTTSSVSENTITATGLTSFSDFEVGAVPSVVVTPTTLSGFTYAQGSGPSAEKTFTVSGTDLTANITVTPSANYEISTVSGVSFAPTNPITLTPVSGTVATTTVYARLKAGLSAGDFNSENIVVASAGTTDQNVTCSGTVTPAIWSHMITNGSPIAMHYLGDKLASNTWIQFEIGQESWNQSDAGIGKSNSDPSAWTWRMADWFADGGGSNKQVQSDFGDFQFTSTGNWYINGRVKAGSGDPFNYANSVDWQNTTAFTPAYYFTVAALTDPSDQSASAVSASQINLTWTRDATPHNVMVVRKKAADSWTEPTQGAAYAVNATIGSGVVVYNSSGTSLNNTGLDAGTTYDYKFYSENYNYYSPGVIASATTLSAPTISSFTPDNVCAGSVTSVTITGTNFTGATDVRFNGTLVTTYTIVSSTEITADFPAGATTGKISVTTAGGTATSTGDFVVNQLPVAAGTISGTSTVTQGALGVSYSVPAIDNASSYIWAYSGTGATISGTTNPMTIDFSGSATSGNLTVKGRNTCGDGTISANYSITVNTLPVAFNVTGTGSFCSTGTGLEVGLEDSESGVTYKLYKDDVLQTPTVEGDGSAISFGIQTVGTYTVKGTRDPLTTTMTGSAIITMDLVPEAIAGNTQVGASGTSILITGASSAKGTITWSTNSNGSFDDIHLLEPLYTSLTSPEIVTVTLTLTVHNTSCPDAVSTKILFLTPSVTALTWEGGVSESWSNSANWLEIDVPGPGTNVTIPSGKTYYPTLTATANCNNITVKWGASLRDNGYLILSKGAKIIVEHPAISTGQWHYISSPVAGVTSAMFYGNYLYNFNTSTNNYTPILASTTPLTAMKGFALYPKSTAFTGAFVGELNMASSYSITTSASSGQSWCLIGNPYPSSIDWDLVTKSGIASAVYIYIDGLAANPNWSAYVDGTETGGGSNIIAPTQGFFVKGTGGSFVLDNSDRVHAAGSVFKKANGVVPNLLRIEVSGNGYKDDAVVRFKPEATPEFDGEFDALKRYGDVTAAAQLYTLGSIPLAINSLPAVDDVPVGIVIGKSGSYTIAATEINDLGNATLEDTELGISTDLSAGPYTFDAVAGTFDQRFILHFSMLGLTPTKNVEAAIYSFQRTVHINMKDQVKGDIFIYNISGQQVASKLAAQGMNEIKLTSTGNYIVKVISKNSTIVRKVFILQ